MNKYIVRNPQVGSLISSHVKKKDLIERKRLLLNLMATRDAVRVVCAPALFGKTILALQYAKIIFADQSVVWVKADDLCFLRDLDARCVMDSFRHVLEKGPTCELFVFDGVPKLSEKRLQEFVQLIYSLKLSDCEVLITTRCKSLFSGEGLELQGKLELNYVTAHDLLLDSQEDTSESPDTFSSLQGWVRPAVLCDKNEGSKRLFTNLQHMEVCSSEDAVALLALIIGKGAQSIFSCFIVGFAAIDLQSFNEYYPHAGLRNRGFVALELSAQERFSLLWVHLAKLVELSLYPSQKEFVLALLDELYNVQDYALIQLVLKFCLIEEERSDFYEKHEVTYEFIKRCVEELVAEKQKNQACDSSDSQKPVSSDLQKPDSSDSQRSEDPRESNLQKDDLRSVKSQDGDLQNNSLLKSDLCKIESPENDLYANDFEENDLRGNKGELLARKKEPMAQLDAPEKAFKQSASGTVPKESGCFDRFDSYAEFKNLTTTESIAQESENADKPERLVVNLFGRFEMKRGKRLVPERGEIRKLAKIMIALLVINSQKDLPRTWVERAVWPENYTSTVTSNFYNLWSYIKRTLSETDEERRLLGRTRDSISLRELHIESDIHTVNLLCNEFSTAHEVEDCVRILSQLERVYQGPLMPGIENAQLESYRNKFQNKVLDVLTEGSRIIYSKGNRYVALHFAGFAFGQNIAREDVCYLYMFIQKELGHYTGAINTYVECRGALVDEYGIDAPRRLDALYEEIIKEVS